MAEEHTATTSVAPVGTVAAKAAVAPLILTLDIGTSSLRALLYDRYGRAIQGTEARVTYEARATVDGGVELIADEIVDGVGKVIDAALAQAGDLRTHIAAVSSDTFWHNMLALDNADRAISPIFTWADTRATASASDLKRELDERQVHQRTGCVLHASYWPAKLRWLKRTQPDLVRRAAHWVSIGEYLYTRFCGERHCSVSMASGTGLLNQHTRDWDDEVLGALPIDRDHLSPLTSGLVPVGTLSPALAKRWPTLREVPWFPAAGDGACSNVGSGCTDQGQLALMIGTSGALRVCFAAEDVPVQWGLWCYHATPQYFVLGGALSNGGNLWEWLQRSLQLPRLEEQEAALAALEPDGHGLTVLPFLAGERSPNWVGSARAAFTGVSLSTEPIHFLQAGLEAVSYRFALLYKLLQGILPNTPRIVANGGAVLSSPMWMQMLADVLGAPVIASGEQEATSRGAALLALLALREISTLEDPSVAAALGQTFRPNPSRHERYQAGAERQRHLYELLIGPSL